MPLSRHQIRNEYSLADPDLYRAADKDDPEALLEGVAMAGLVGVLRQLGDLAEFAAEIFHGLHEEVTATASRGHSLMVRVQQLEAEFPTIEKAFLSQTSDSSFYYNAGIDWHPNVRMDQNLITQGDLPRFIMDSYEECRGPPRLFLLDKFDVAGAGACLKRYTDPSVFNVGISYPGITSSDVLREKKARKAKKKGSRWRNGETPETLPSSHAKLHQLFLEERIESGASDYVRRVKLKRRLNGFPFDNRSGKSYMEKFVKSSSPDHEEVHEIPVDASPLALPYNNTNESALEIVEISRVSPEKEPKQTMRSPSSSPTREGATLEMAFDELNEFPSPKGVYEVSKSNSCLEANDISSILHEGVTEKEISVDGGIKTEGSVDDYQSDDAASEIDNYVDALTTMESEMDTDSELRSKNGLHYMNRRSQASEIDANREQVHAHFSDSLSMGNSSLSDDGNSSSKKDLSSFSCSDSHSISAENTPSDGEVSSNVFSSTEIHEAEDSPTQLSIGREEQAASDDAFTEPVEIPSRISKLDDPAASSTSSDSGPFEKNEEAGVKEIIASLGPETENMVANLNVDFPSVPSANACQQEGDYSCSQMFGDNQHVNEFEDENINKTENYSCSQMFGDNQHVNEFEDENINKTENMGYTSHLSVPSPSRNGLPFQVSAENKFDCKIEDEDSNQQEDLASTFDCTVVPQVMVENPSLSSFETRPLYELHDEDPNWRENSSSASNHSDARLQSRDDLSPKMSAKNLQVDDSDVENPNFLLDAPVCASDTIDAATQNTITENMLENVSETGCVEYNLIPDAVENHVDPQNLVMTHTKDQSIDPTSAELETHYSKVPFERDCEIDDAIQSGGEKAENVIFKEDIPIICQQSFVPGTADIQPLGPSNEITSHFREEDFDEPSGLGDDAVKDEANSDSHLLETDTTSEPSLMAGIHVHADKVDHEPLDVPATFAGHSIHAAEDDDGGSSVDDKKLLEEPFTIVKEVHNGIETGLLDGPGESDITEDLDHQKFASPDSLCNIVANYDLALQACDDASDIYIVSKASSSLTPGDVRTHQLSLGQNEKELHHPEDKFDLEMQESKEKLCNGGEANSELLNRLQQTHYSDHDDQAGTFDAPSEPLLANIPSQPSASELLSDGNSMIDVTEHLLDRSSLLSSGFSLPPYSSQIYVEEMPPLPPLPPVQWRMGKLQHANQAPVEVSAKHSPTAFPPLLPCSTNQAAQPLVPFLPPSVSAYEMSIPVLEQPISNISPFLSQVPPVVLDGDSKDNVLPPEGIGCTRTSAELPGSHGEMLQNVFHAGEREKVQTSLDSSHASAINADSADALRLSHQEVVKPLNQMAPEKILKDTELGQCSAQSEDNVMASDISELPSNVANEHAMPTSEEKLSWSTTEDGKLHGVRTLKLPRPRNPLIDAVAAHDKSKLRKVTERVRPDTRKEDERDSLLEQIRTKSFNLKPAVVNRTSVRGPKTNLKVAAILEKAKTIRQAFAGSDEEEDDDNWSDS